MEAIDVRRVAAPESEVVPYENKADTPPTLSPRIEVEAVPDLLSLASDMKHQAGAISIASIAATASCVNQVHASRPEGLRGFKDGSA